MKFLVDVERNGPTQFFAASNRIEFRKPDVFNPDKHKIEDYKTAEAKIDGHRVLVIGRLEDRKMNVVTTSGIDIAEEVMQCHWASLLSKRMTDLEYFDGELYLPGYGREYLSTALAERNPGIRFAVIGHSGTPPLSSAKHLQDLVLARKCDLDVPDWAPILEGETGKLIKSRQLPVTQESLLANVKELGPHYDGIMLKSGMYGDWVKFKHRLTADVVILGFKPAKEGKYLGQVGSILCGCYDGNTDIVYEVAYCSGMDDSIRAGLTEADLGRVIEVAYEKVGTRGRFQHPRFVAWRDDKKPEDCKLEQDPELAAFYAEDEE